LPQFKNSEPKYLNTSLDVIPPIKGCINIADNFSLIAGFLKTSYTVNATVTLAFPALAIRNYYTIKVKATKPTVYGWLCYY